MKILFYNHTGQVSGAERVLMMILNGLDREIYQPAVVCPPSSKMMEIAGTAHVDTLPLDQLEARFTWRLDRLAKYVWSFASVIKRARGLVKKERPDVIHANSIRAGLVMSAATIGLRVPVVWHAHDILPLHPLSTLVRLVALLTSQNHILAVSHAVEFAFRGALLRPFKARVPITVIHNAVDLDRFQPDVSLRHEMRRVLGLSEDQSVVGIVGQLTPRKGQLELIRAFASVVRSVPNAVLLIAGEALFNRDEEYASQLQDTADALKLTDQVRFLGPRDDVPKLLQALDVLVVNSHQEPFALTVLEGLASGVPVLATAVGGTPEMIQHDESGWLVKSGLDEELSKGLVRLLTDGDLRARLSSAARQKAIGQYSISRYLTDVDSLYRGIINDRKIPEQKNLPGLQLNVDLD
jgi:glycosyltransferase involved in cell wall biosynthesis